MTMTTIGLILVLLLFFSLTSGLWVSFSLLLVGMVGMLLNGNDWGQVAASTAWSSISVWSLTALPMFLWMGEILFRTKLSKNLFDGLSIWFDRIPGKLFHVNIVCCGVFAAVSGSSAATVATIGHITLGHLKRLGYKRSLAIGSLGGAGTLGLLIPPSIVLIVYAVAADISISRLFIAGIFPGVMLMLMFQIYVIIYCAFHPDAITRMAASQYSMSEKFRATLKLIPVLTLVFAVIGSIYIGLATPSEAAAVGVIGALTLGFLDRSLNIRIFIDGLLGAVRTSSMLLFIIVSANVLSISMAYIGIPRELAKLIGEMNLSSGILLFFLGGLFLVLGCFLDGISIILLTTSVILPIIKTAGIDLIWFGIFLVLIVEMSQITPPVGFNLFVLQSLTGENIFKITLYTLPFFFIILIAVFLIWFFPLIVTYLPQGMG